MAQAVLCCSIEPQQAPAAAASATSPPASNKPTAASRVPQTLRELCGSFFFVLVVDTAPLRYGFAHQLVRTFVRGRCDIELGDEARSRITAALHTFVGLRVSELKTIADRSVREVAAMLAVESEPLLSVCMTTTDMHMLDVLERLSRLFHDAGLYRQNATALRFIYSIGRSTLGERHPDTLTAMGNLALTLSRMGDDAGACTLAAQVLAIRRELFGSAAVFPGSAPVGKST
jgi:hypothetical protein